MVNSCHFPLSTCFLEIRLPFWLAHLEFSYLSINLLDFKNLSAPFLFPGLQLEDSANSKHPGNNYHRHLPFMDALHVSWTKPRHLDLCHLILTKSLWIKGNTDPEELAQIQLGDIWESRDVCKCLFDSTAQTLNQHSCISRQSPRWLTVPISKPI